MTSTNWHETTFGELIEIKHGFAFKGEFFGEAGEHIVLTPGNFHEHGGMKLKSAKEKFYTDVPPDEYVLNRGDLIVAMTDLVQNAPILGSSAFVPESGKFLHNQRLGKITVKRPDLVSPEFTFWLFNSYSVRGQIKGSATGSTVRHTSPSRIYEVSVELPPLPTQRKIASILSAYDDLIENNTRRIAILEEMAQAIYREWFVNFRFPGHENVKLVDSPLGQIPEGWEIVSLDSVAHVHRGRSYKSSNLVDEGGRPFLNLKCVNRDGGFRHDGIKRYEGPSKESQIAERGDIIMAVTDMTQERRIVARAALVPTLDGDGEAVFSMDLVKVEPLTTTPTLYLYAMLRYSSFADEIKQHANGANVLHLSPKAISSYNFPLPPVELTNGIAEQLEGLISLCDTLSRKNDILRQTRDLLLPKLISGKLDVEDLDIDVGMTAEALEEATA